MNLRSNPFFMLGESGHDRYGNNTPYHRLGGPFCMNPYWYDLNLHKSNGKNTFRHTKHEQKRSR